VWNALYFTAGDYRADPRQFGPNGTAAHSWSTAPGSLRRLPIRRRTFLGGDKTDQYLRGSYLQGWSAPDITTTRGFGLGAWSKDDLTAYLKSGHNRVTACTTGPMGEVVTLSTCVHDGSRTLAAICDPI